MDQTDAVTIGCQVLLRQIQHIGIAVDADDPTAGSRALDDRARMATDPDRGVAVLARVSRTQEAHGLLKEDREVRSVRSGSDHVSVHAFLERRGS